MSYRANLQKVLDSAARKVLEKRGRQVLAKAKSKVLDLDALNRSLDYALRGSGHKNYTARVSATSTNALAVEEGAKGYFIYPTKPGGVLVFPHGPGGYSNAGSSGTRSGRSREGLVFAIRVFHPPVKARHYLKDSVNETIGRAD